MGHIIPNEFTSYHLTEEELIEGSKLTYTQKQVIQNKIAMCASEKLLLKPDPTNLELYYQQEAHLRGQIDAMTMILAESTLYEEQTKADIYDSENPYDSEP